MAIPFTTNEMILLSLTLIIQFFIGIILFYKIVKLRIKNLWYLALFNITIGMAFLLSRLMVHTDNEIWAPIFQIFTLTSQLLIITFLQKTFYKQKKSPYKIVMLFLIGNFLFAFILQLFTTTFTHLSLVTLVIYLTSYSIDLAISGYWLAIISLKHYFKYKKVSMEPWIKARYLLSGIAALAYSNLGIPAFLNVLGPFNPFLSFLSFLLRAILTIVFSIGSLIAWTMPNKIKIFFNSSFTMLEDSDFTEEEIKKEFDNL